jgi:hypothetical protein
VLGCRAAAGTYKNFDFIPEEVQQYIEEAEVGNNFDSLYAGPLD